MRTILGNSQFGNIYYMISYQKKGNIMRKYLALLFLLPTALMIISGAANAQRKNTTSHDIPAKIEADISKDFKEAKNDIKEKIDKHECDCKKIKHCCKKCKKMHKKHKKDHND